MTATTTLAVIALARLVADCRFGLDLSDDGLYLLSASQKSKNTNIDGTWGNFAHILLVAANGDVARFRAFGVVLIAASGAALGIACVWLLLGPLPLPRRSAIRSASVVAGGLIGATTLPVYYSVFLITPSYNWCSLLATTIVDADLAFWLALPCVRRPREYLQWALATAAVLIALISRPINAVVLVSAVLLVQVVRVLRVHSGGRRKALAALLLAGPVVALTSAVFFVTVSSPQEIIRSINRVRVWTSASPEESISYFIATGRAELSSLARSSAIEAMPAVIGLAVITALAVLFKRRNPNGCGWITTACEAAYLLSFIGLSLRLWRDQLLSGGPNVGNTVPKAVASQVVLAVVICLSRYVIDCLDAPHFCSRAAVTSAGRAITLLLLLVVSMYSYGFSSVNGLVPSSSLAAGLAFSGAAAVLLGCVRTNALRGLGLAVTSLFFSLTLITMVDNGAANPYRAFPLSQDTSSATLALLGHTSRLAMAPAQTAFIEGIRSAAARAGFRAGTPVEDFTPGQGVFTAGILVLLEGQAPPTLMPVLLDEPPSVTLWGVAQQSAVFRRTAWIAVGNDGTDLAAAAGIVAHRTAADYQLVYQSAWPSLGETISLYRPKSDTH